MYLFFRSFILRFDYFQLQKYFDLLSFVFFFYFRHRRRMSLPFNSIRNIYLNRESFFFLCCSVERKKRKRKKASENKSTKLSLFNKLRHATYDTKRMKWTEELWRDEESSMISSRVTRDRERTLEQRAIDGIVYILLSFAHKHMKRQFVFNIFSMRFLFHFSSTGNSGIWFGWFASDNGFACQTE